MTYIHLEQAWRNKNVHAFFGFKLQDIPACSQDMVKQIYRAQHAFIGNLALPEDSALELRFFTNPIVSDCPVVIVLFCRVTQSFSGAYSDTSKAALALAQQASESVSEALAFFLSDFYHFQPLMDAPTFKAFFEPFSTKSVVEFTRRQEFIADEVMMREYAYDDFPYWPNILKVMTQEVEPLYLSVTLQKTTIQPWERTRCLNTHHRSDYQVHGSHHTLQLEVAEAQKQVLDEFWTPYLMRLQMVSSEPHISPLAQQVVGHTLAGYGRFQTVSPRSQAESGISFTNARHMTFRLWCVNYLKEDHKRFLHLFSLREASVVFCLPMDTSSPSARILRPRIALPQAGVCFGQVMPTADPVPLLIPEEDMFRHAFLLGRTGTGKSTTLKQIIMDRINQGQGVGVLDPHGDLIDEILPCIPENRLEDVVLFAPSDRDYPIGFNLLHVENELERDLIAAEFQSILLKLYGDEYFGPIAQHYNYQIVLTLMENLNQPGTILDIPLMLTNERYRNQWVKQVSNPILKSFWRNEFFDLTTNHNTRDMIPYLCSKYGQFINSSIMRHILGQPKSTINLKQVMNGRKIFLASLAKGLIGEMNSQLLGMLLLTKFLLQAFSRSSLPLQERVPFTLVIDEIQNFTAGRNQSHSSGMNQSLSTAISEGRKYGLSLVLANQFFDQLPSSVQEAVLGNVGTLLNFRLGIKDSQLMLPEFPGLSGSDLVNQNNFHAYCRPLINGKPQPVCSLYTSIDRYPKNDTIAQQIRDLSRQKYSKDRLDVEMALDSRLAVKS